MVTSAEGIPAASALIATAPRTTCCGRSASRTGWAGALGLARGRLAHMAGIPRWSGSELIVLASSRIAETPSTSAWWVLV